MAEIEVQNVCSIIDSYPAQIRPGQYALAEKNVCTPIWVKGIAPWQRPENRRALIEYGTSKQKHATTHLNHRRGSRYATPQEQVKIIEDAKIERVKVSAECCGSNVACKAAMDKVEFKFCEQSKDWTKPDRCLSPVASFYMSNGNLRNIIDTSIQIAQKNFPKLTLNERRNLESMVEKKEPRASSEFDFSPGWVKMTNYVFGEGNTFVSEATLRHELGHACSHVQRQLALKDPKRQLGAATTFIELALNNKNDCDISQKKRTLFASLLPRLENRNAVIDCIAAGAENESTD
ncbi:MAG: hypothetical protein V4692_16405, partial [Bdellovibrionota bacterium]